MAENFNPEVGFLRRRDYRKAEGRLFRTYRPDDFWGLHELRPHIAYNGYWTNDGYYESGVSFADVGTRAWRRAAASAAPGRVCIAKDGCGPGWS